MGINPHPDNSIKHSSLRLEKWLTTKNITASLWSRQGAHRDTPNVLPFLFSRSSTPYWLSFLQGWVCGQCLVFITGLTSALLGPVCLLLSAYLSVLLPPPKCCTLLCSQASDPIFCFFIIPTCWDLNVSCLYPRTVYFSCCYPGGKSISLRLNLHICFWLQFSFPVQMALSPLASSRPVCSLTCAGITTVGQFPTGISLTPGCSSLSPTVSSQPLQQLRSNLSETITPPPTTQSSKGVLGTVSSWVYSAVP